MAGNKADEDHQGTEEILSGNPQRVPAYQGLGRRTAVELSIPKSLLSDASQ